MATPKIAGLRVSGFKKFQEPFALDFRDPQGRPLKTIVLGGSNGSGKTTVLEALLAGMGRANLVRVPSDIGSAVELLASAAVEVDLQDGELARVARFERGQLEVSDGQGIGFELDAMAFLAGIPLDYYSSWRAPSLVGGVRPMTVGRRPGDTEANRLWRLKQKIVDQRSRKGFQQALPGIRPLDDVWLERLNAIWRIFHGPGSGINADIVDPAAEDPVFDLFVLEGDRRVCSVDHCASGEIEILSLCASLITQDFDGVLLLDEPELHLHPEWQGGLLPALRTLAPDAQIIVSTHSDIIWDQVYSYERFLLGPDEDPRKRLAGGEREGEE
jgi:predicted ATPase